MLGHYRVVDLTDQRGQVCGHLLGSLGAEVILVEPPGGSPARRIGPFADDIDDGEHALGFWHHNRGKRSAVIDLESGAGPAQLDALIRSADVVIEAGGRDEQRIDPSDYAESNPGLIHAMITPYGGDGPRSDWAATDLTILAASASLILNGDHDRAPVRIAPPGQGWFHGSAEAACAILTALAEREHSGLGQSIDVSAAQAANQATISQSLSAPLNAVPTQRSGKGLRLGGLDVQVFWPCRDGFSIIVFLFGLSLGPFTERLMKIIHAEGFCDEATRDKDWVEYTMMLLDGREPVAEYERCKSVIGEWAATKTKAELMRLALDEKLLIVPIRSMDDVATSSQLESREFWEDVEQPYGTVRYPGAMAKFEPDPLPAPGPPPSLAQHTDEVLTSSASRSPTLPADPQRDGALPLDGLRVVDLSWVMVGPQTCRMLSDAGATVVRVESTNRLDTARTLQPFRDDDADPEYSGLYGNNNAGKLGMTLNLADPRGREVLMDLVAWADVLVEAYAPGVLARWGLTHEDFQKVNPTLIMASTSLLGETGPQSGLAGFGTMAAAVAGFHYIVGWPDRWPAGPFGAYTDTVAPRYLYSSILAGLERRRRTGEGCYLDLSQAEAAMPFLGSTIMDRLVNGRVRERLGNADPTAAPHGVFPCRGEDRWVAVAVETDQQWHGLCSIVGIDESSDRHAVEEQIAAWTSTLDPDAAAQALQRRDVPAYAVLDSAMAVADPQLRHRGHFVQVPHDTQPDGVTWVEAPRALYSRTPLTVTQGAPTLGQHSFEVLSEILGYDADKIADLAVAELLE